MIIYKHNGAMLFVYSELDNPIDTGNHSLNKYEFQLYKYYMDILPSITNI